MIKHYSLNNCFYGSVQTLNVKNETVDIFQLKYDGNTLTEKNKNANLQSYYTTNNIFFFSYLIFFIHKMIRNIDRLMRY
jgi:hypothetical protein